MTSLAVCQPSPKVLAQHATRGPRYTSYPPAPHFSKSFGHDEASEELAGIANGANAKAGVSIYAHIPFCTKLCWYCGCNVKITRDRDQGHRYVETLVQEFRLYGERLPGMPLRALSLGGGSPNFLSAASLRYLVDELRAVFPAQDDTSLAIELDPRDTPLTLVDELASMGFTRVNVGVQDFEERVQETINRHQSREETEAVFARARAAGVSSAGVDLIYGLPGQTSTTFARTLDAVLAMTPDRIALFGYAHLPHIMKHQKLVERDPIPGLQGRAELLTSAITHLIGAGYVRVGFDHFALPGDPMARALAEKRLQRNFQGFTTTKGGPLIACGVTGISDTHDAYWQNTSDLDLWKEEIEAGRLPIARGLSLSAEDHLRRYVIFRLMCDGRVDVAEVEARYEIRFSEFFAHEIVALKEPETALLVENQPESGVLSPSPLGVELIRNLCMVFDPHLRASKPSGSTTI